jgi:uncharacterized protein (TIGR02145 family)
MAENMKGSGLYYDDCISQASTENCEKYGGMYQASFSGVCPSGWHIPSFNEWNTLIGFVESDSKCNNCAGTKLKTRYDWDNNGNGTDDYGFAALPAHYMEIYKETMMLSQYYSPGTSGYWWVDKIGNGENNPYVRMLSSNNRVESGNGLMYNSYSVRCLKN